MFLYHPALRVLAAVAAFALVAVFLLVTVLRAASNGPQGSLTFAYHQHNGSGRMDQTLEILNAGSSAVVPRLEIVPVDSSGAAVAGVHVSTAYGSDEGRLLAAAQTISLDVLAFTGGDAPKVADVRVTVLASATVEFPVAPQEVVVQAVDAAGEPTSKYGPFWSVELTNPNPKKVTAGVVCILWDQPPAGQSQQARIVIPVGVTTIAANASTTIRAGGAAADGCGSLKAYFTTLDHA
ncbi:hypothetical protein [Actinoplanes sp. NPDC026619]|uniref:hypothetical protein n=1 Tax=Actinoplanes sp. NPDC026619 TaxID=3155798 RepID=UPI0033C9F5EC